MLDFALVTASPSFSMTVRRGIVCLRAPQAGGGAKRCGEGARLVGWSRIRHDMRSHVFVFTPRVNKSVVTDTRTTSFLGFMTVGSSQRTTLCVSASLR